MNKPEFYPYVLLPEEIEKIKIEGIPVPELRDLPEFPEKPKKRFLGTIILIVSIGIMILLGSTHIIKSSFYSNTITYLAFFISLVSLTATVFEIMHNSKSKKQYRIAVKLYNELKAEREQIKEERRKAIEDNNNQKAIDAYRHSAINTYFKYSYNKIQIGQREYTPAQKRFLIFLEQYFEGKILENARITHELKEIDYSPDFILKLDNPKVNIAIDIEEPYSFEGKKIVVKKNRSDEAYKLRYKVTNELRWVCIVFNEEQVVTQPTESCKLIAHAIDEILLKEKFSKQFKAVNKIKRAEIPGQRELSAFIRNKYRENYLLAAGLIDNTDFISSEVEIRKNGSDEAEKIIKTSQELQSQKSEDRKINELKDKKSIIDTNGKSKSIIIEKKEEENGDIEQLEIAKKAAEKFKSEKKEKESENITHKKAKKENEIKSGLKEKSETIDIDKKKQNVKKELLKSIEAKLEEEKKSKTTKRISLKKEAEKLNILYSKSKENKDSDLRQKEKERIANEKAEKERIEKERIEKVRLEKERLLKKKEEEQEKEKQELSLAEKAKLKRDEHVKERISKEKDEKERLEKERQEKVNAEKERVAKEKAEKEKSEQERTDKEHAQKEKLEKERLIKEKAEKERVAKEKAGKEKLEQERTAKEHAQKEKLEKERLIKEKAEKEQHEKDRIAKEKAEKQKMEQERVAKEKARKEQIEKERIVKEKAEKEEELKKLELAEKVSREKERIEKMQKELEEKQKIEARNRLMEKYKKQIEVLVANKEWDMLFDACNEAIKEFPYWEWPYYRRSTMHGNKGQFVDAIEDCNRALSINPKLTDAVYNRATAKFYLQKYEEALEDYQKCIDLNYKNSAEAYFNRGLCFQNLDQPKKAFREFVKAKNLGSVKAIDVLNSQYS